MIRQELILSNVLLVLSKMNHTLLGCMRDVFKTYRAPFFIYHFYFFIPQCQQNVSKNPICCSLLFPSGARTSVQNSGQLFSQVISQLVQGWLWIGWVLGLNTSQQVQCWLEIGPSDITACNLGIVNGWSFNSNLQLALFKHCYWCVSRFILKQIF